MKSFFIAVNELKIICFWLMITTIIDIKYEVNGTFQAIAYYFWKISIIYVHDAVDHAIFQQF